MKITRRFALFLILIAALTVPNAVHADDALTLTILHTNDLHGHVLPFAYTEIGRGKDEQASVGGAARRATLVRKIRRDTKNPVILVDAGDTFTRGPLTNAYEGIADIEAMNAVGYELAAIGNNEFKAKDAIEQNDAAGSQSALLQVIKRAKFPWLCANAFGGNGALLEGVQPYVVRNWGGVRVGFLGLTAPRSANYPQTVGWKITDPIAAAEEWIPKARAHCDVLIAVTHLGTDLDKELAARTRGIDAIVGGDSHTFLYQAVDVKNADGASVPIVQTGEFGVNLGRFDLRFVRSGTSWKLADYKYELIPVGPKIAEARDVKAIVAPFVKPLDVVVGTIANVGATPEERTRRTTQSLVDALRADTNADLALNPSGAGFFDAFHQRKVTRYDVLAALPFKNRIATASLTGAEVAALLKAQPTTVASGDVAHLNPARAYKVAFVDFVASDTYRLPAAKITATERDIRDALIAFLGK